MEQIQQNTYDRKNTKNTIPEALILNREKTSKMNQYTEWHIPTNTEQNRKRDQKTEFADIETHQIGIRTRNVHLENEYAIIVKRNRTSQKHANSNTENDTKLKKLRDPKRPRKVIPTSQKI